MKKEIKLLFDNLKNKKRNNKVIRNITITLSCFVALITLYILMSPAITLNTVGEYKLYLKDTNLNDNYIWKTENGYQTSIGLDLNYVDSNANPFRGKNITIDVNNKSFAFGKTDSEVINILKENEIETILVDNGKYIYDHAEVYLNDKWEQLSSENTIWCQNSLSETEPIEKDYGFKGTYGTDKLEFVINDKVEYKLVYNFEEKEIIQEEIKEENNEQVNETENLNNTEQQNNIDTKNNEQQENKELENNNVNNEEINNKETETNKVVEENKETETDKVTEENKETTNTEEAPKVPIKSTAPKTTLKSPKAALSTANSVLSLGKESGIKFGIYDYSGDNTGTGDNNVNNNGLYGYFSFRDSTLTPGANINAELDADGFGEGRIRVNSKLDGSKNPVFNCQGKCTGVSNTSLGYLFGNSTNAKGTATVGVQSYNPNNTLLQTEKVDGVDYYYYDSNRNAVDYDTTNNNFLVRNYVERGYTATTFQKESNRYEFLPFNYKANASSPNGSYNYESATNTTEINHWYGMTMEFEFYMPKNGTINAKDMIFSFSGDDDVWVFIDDVLVLDLGGTHGAVDGSINFRTGEVKSYLNWSGTVGTVADGTANNTTIKQMFSNAGVSKEWNQAGTTFADYTKHTLKFFYLERGAAVANCKIRFNIPVLPSGSLSVQKQFEGTEKYADNYEFVIYDVTTGSPVANGTKYTIGETEYTINNNEGKFTLKNNEVAIFVSKTEQDDPNGEYLRSSHKYYVRESSAGEHSEIHSCKFDNSACPSIDKTGEFTMTPDSKYLTTFTNKTKTYNLKVTKEAINSSEGEKFDFKITMKDENGNIVDISKLALSFPNGYTIDSNNKGIISFQIEDDQSITINNIPINTVINIQELDHDGYHTSIKSIVNGKEVPLVESDTYTINQIKDNKDIKVYNTPGVILPETGGIGTLIYTVIGLSLIIVSITFGYAYFYKEKEGGQ